MKGSPFVAHYERNVAGRDFAVGDIHGCFRLLQTVLDGIGFNPENDRLFSVGDLVDRGPDSELALEWITKSWFHAIQGNHEDMAIRYVNPGHRDAAHYAMNGGAWLIGKTPQEQQEFALGLSVLPYAIEVETADGVVGIVHADVAGETWGEMVERFSKVDSNSKLKAITNHCMWDRIRCTSEDASGVRDVRAVIVGHTPLKRPTALGNVFHIDTGAVFRDGYFTLIDLATLETIPPMPTKLDWAA